MSPQRYDDYEIWGEEHIVEIHEVQLKFDGVIMSTDTPLIVLLSHSTFRYFLSHFRNSGHWKYLPRHHGFAERPSSTPI